MADRTLAAAVAATPITSVTDEFIRHASPRERVLEGSSGGGRWGPIGGYPVIYLGRPEDSVVVEAYRHLVDDVEGMRPELVRPRTVTTYEVAVTDILDLRDPASLQGLGLDPADLTTEINDYDACLRIGQAAHQLGLHGILAPSASGLGETLALFPRHLPEDQHPIPRDRRTWNGLPADPRAKGVPGSSRSE